MTAKRSLDTFAAEHGAAKMKRLEGQLEAEQIKVKELAKERRKPLVLKVGAEFSFGLFGCSHFGSLYAASRQLAAFYRYAHDERGVSTFLCGGDVLDGWKVYRGQEFELQDVGWDAQINRFALEVPRIPGVETHFITGNHDASFKRLVGVNVGAALASVRPDWKFIGTDVGNFIFEAPGGRYSVRLIHPDGGSSYALSYKPQKITESLEGGTKPNFLGIAHFHKAEFMPSYRNIAVCQTGCFQWQTPFMARGGLAAHVGGWIINVRVAKDANIVRPEFVAFYAP